MVRVVVDGINWTTIYGADARLSMSLERAACVLGWLATRAE